MHQDTANADLFADRDARPTAEQIRAQTERILSSKHFRQAASLERFLRHVVEKTLAGAEQELKEYAIGVEVFQRGADFEPGADAVVRVQASKLRKKLDSFYEDEGASDAVVIELPKGHYVARFAARRDEGGALVALEGEPARGVTLAAQPEAARHLVTAGPSTAPPSPRRWAARLRFAAVFLTGILSVLVAQQLGGISSRRGEAAKAGNPAAPRPDLARHALWRHFLKPGASNVLAFGTPQFFNANGIYFRDVRVNSSAELSTSPELVSIQKNLGQELRPMETYTGVGEAQGVYALSRFFFAHEQDVRVARNRLVGWEQIKSSNVILLSSLRFHTLADELAYPSDFTLTADVTGNVINKRPQPGERAEYRRDARDDYAVVTLWPGKLPDRRVLYLSGVTTWATAAAAEYVTEPEHLRELDAQLADCARRGGRPEHAPYFQVLLRVEVKDNQPVGISYVTHHDLEVGAAQGQVAMK
jgi:hypothetical protein